MNQQQQYQMMPTSPPHLLQQYQHNANLRAYYAQLPYSGPSTSTVPPSNAAPNHPAHQHPNGGAPVPAQAAQAETDEEVYGEEEVDPNDPPVEFDEKLYQRVMNIEKILPVLHTNQRNKKKEEDPKAMAEQQPPYEDQAAQAASDHPDVLAAFQAQAALLGGATSTHV